MKQESELVLSFNKECRFENIFIELCEYFYKDCRIACKKIEERRKISARLSLVDRGPARSWL